jgi:hypothetical protein
MTTPKARVALTRVLDLTKSAKMTVPKEQNGCTKSGGPYQKRDKTRGRTWMCEDPLVIDIPVACCVLFLR